MFETLFCHYLLAKVLIKMGFFIPYKIFVFLGACLSKIETTLFSKTAWVLIADIIANIEFKLVALKLFEIAVY